MRRASLLGRTALARRSLAASAAVVVFVLAGDPRAARAQGAQGGAQGANKTDEATLARAREQYDRARALGQRGKFEEARKILEETWKLKKHWEVGAYLGRAEVKTGRYRSAAEHSAYALRVISSDADPTERRQLEQQYAEAKAQITTVQLRGVEPNAVVAVDGHEREAIFGEDPLFLHPGVHQIEVREEGRPPRQRTMTAEVGTATELDMSAEAIERIRLAPVPEAPPGGSSHAASDWSTSEMGKERGASWRPRTWVVVSEAVVAAVALGVGVGFALRAESLDSDAKKTMSDLRAKAATPCGTPNETCTQVNGMYADRDQSADWAKATLITGGALGLATVATLLLWPRETTTLTAFRRAGRSYWLSPSGGSSTGLTLGGTF